MGALVSLVMSDIVESTRRWAADEAAMAADLEQHDRVLRAALEGAGGTVCKHTGDGMLAMFDDPAAAVDAAAADQGPRVGDSRGAADRRHAIIRRIGTCPIPAQEGPDGRTVQDAGGPGAARRKLSPRGTV
ncbi:MAG: hypothetical protein FJX69_04415 [Alphaproteobacteria bacterium]|nr:hypothetical protein [Alphaproteobacteria bacterium]